MAPRRRWARSTARLCLLSTRDCCSMTDMTVVLPSSESESMGSGGSSLSPDAPLRTEDREPLRFFLLRLVMDMDRDRLERPEATDAPPLDPVELTLERRPAAPNDEHNTRRCGGVGVGVGVGVCMCVEVCVEVQVCV